MLVISVYNAVLYNICSQKQAWWYIPIYSSLPIRRIVEAKICLNMWLWFGVLLATQGLTFVTFSVQLWPNFCYFDSNLILFIFCLMKLNSFMHVRRIRIFSLPLFIPFHPLLLHFLFCLSLSKMLTWLNRDRLNMKREKGREKKREGKKRGKRILLRSVDTYGRPEPLRIIIIYFLLLSYLLSQQEEKQTSPSIRVHRSPWHRRTRPPCLARPSATSPAKPLHRRR